MPEDKVKSLLSHEVDPRNAEGTIDLDSVDSVTAADQEKRCVLYCDCLPFLYKSSPLCVCVWLFFFRPNSFAVITVGRVFNLVAESPAAMHQWIGGVLFLCGFNSVLLS